jgi:hypothetical protein
MRGVLGHDNENVDDEKLCFIIVSRERIIVSQKDFRSF